MSQRGSLVTEFIYCEECFQKVRMVLLRDRSGMLKSWTLHSHLAESPTRVRPIIAGEIQGMYGGEEWIHLEHEVIPKIEQCICHPLRIAVLTEDEEKIYKILPQRKDNEST